MCGQWLHLSLGPDLYLTNLKWKSPKRGKGWVLFTFPRCLCKILSFMQFCIDKAVKGIHPCHDTPFCSPRTVHKPLVDHTIIDWFGLWTGAEGLWQVGHGQLAQFQRGNTAVLGLRQEEPGSSWNSDTCRSRPLSHQHQHSAHTCCCCKWGY